MRCHSVSSYGLFLAYLLAEVARSLPTENVRYNDSLDQTSVTNILAHDSRNLRKYDPFTITPLKVAGVLQLCNSTVPQHEITCLINVKKLGYDHALIINSTDHTSFVYPDEYGNIVVRYQETVFLSCPGHNNTLKNVPGSPQYSNFACVCGPAYDALGTIYDFHELTCQFPPKYEIVDKGFYGRESEYRKFEIGFYTDGARRFLKVIDAHYDRATTSTMHTRSVISRFIAGQQKPAKLDRYDQTHCCERQQNRLDIDAIYNTKAQDRSFAAQLYCHDSEFHTRCSYLSESSAIVFNRVQLSPKSSFVYTSSGSTTFVYLNTGPQWRPINEGNWARIEDHVVEIAKQLRKDLVIFTGVYERLRLKDTGDNNREKMIFLYAGVNNDRSIAIPLYFWKIVYEPSSKRGIAYVALNNPYAERGEDYHICEKPMFSKDGALMPRQWKPKNVAKGYSYMCEVADFVRSNSIVLNDFSAASVTGLLYLARNETLSSGLIQEYGDIS